MIRLENLRLKINEIDDDIIKLLEKRLDIAKDIGLLKKELDIPVLDKSREDIIINKISNMVLDKSKRDKITNIYIKIMEESKNLQK